MTSREAALNALCEVDAGVNLKDALGKIFERDELNEDDRSLANELAFGTLRHREEIDQIVRETYVGDFKVLDAIVKNVMRIAVYQYLFLDRIPVYAIVNEAANGGRSVKEKALINAVLRGIIRNKRVQSMREPQVWVYRKILEAYPDEGEKIIEAFKLRPTPYIRINALRSNGRDVDADLRAIGLEVRQGNWLEEYRGVSRLGNLITSSLMRDGLISIHDEAQGLVCRLVAPKPGECIVDLCAAPGGKTTYLGELMRNQGIIIAVEPNQSRLVMVVENAVRLGIAIIRPVLADGRRIALDAVDKVLIDSPCSNSGVIAKRPEVKDRVKKEVLARLVRLQLQLLENGARMLRPGGTLVYSTCSILPQENEEVIEAFLGANAGFSVEPAGPLVACGDRFLKVLPNQRTTDGVFAARLRKSGPSV